MRSPTISNKVTANLFIGIDLDTDGTFSFRHKTSTEEGDVLSLILNGQEVGTWSGIGEWEQSEFELPAGSNVVRFSFKKDNEGSAGEDAVMIDDLRFPPFAKMVLYAGDDTEACPNATFTPDGYIYNQTELIWSTNGDGTFDDATLEHPTYTFGEADKTEGKVELTLTGTCMHSGSQQSSTMTVSLLPYFEPSYKPETPSGVTEVDLRLVSQSEYTAEEIEDVLYTWSIEPETAGTIIGEGSHALVEWDGEYRGEVKIAYAYENTCGSTSISEAMVVNVFNSTGIDEQQSVAVEVYPNPANGVLYVKSNLEGEAVLRVVDLMGKVVYECRMQGSGPSTSSGTTTIATSKFGGEGIYTLQVIQNDVVTSVKVVVMP